MTGNFSGNWQSSHSEPIGEKIKEAMAPSGDLRKRLSETDRALGGQIVKLDKTIAKMNEKENNLLTRTSAAFQVHDTVEANAYANELSELRKAIKLVKGAKLSLESVRGRLRTITDIGDLAMVLSPVGQSVRTVRSALASVMPSANDSMGEINSTLQGLVQEIGQVPALMGLNFEPAGEEAEKILAEASAVAEAKMAAEFPELDELSTATTASEVSSSSSSES